MKQSLIAVVVAAAASLLASLVQGDATPREAKPVTVFILRHAEKADDDQTDPTLSEKGQRRADALGRLLGSSGVTHLFATQFVRTRSTVAPLSNRIGVEVATFSSGNRADQLAAIRELPPGSVAVVAGHSNTVPLLVKGLGGELERLTARGYLDDNAYDRLFVVTLPVGEASTQTIELRYGEPDEAER